MNKSIVFSKSTYKSNPGIVNEHMETLTFPMDSYLDDKLLKGTMITISYYEDIIGYFVYSEDTLLFYYLKTEFTNISPDVFEEIIKQNSIKKVFVLSQDSRLAAILVEWDFTRERAACWFIDSERENDKSKLTPGVEFILAKNGDENKIRAVCDDFLDEPGYVFSNLEERIAAETIFILQKDSEIYGCGLYEKGLIQKEYASIGMFTNPKYRKMGVASTMLVNLKEHVYGMGMKPLAGCWYYNTLSRKSLESAGMVAASLGYIAVLEKRDRPPKRTGNPPGEEVE